MRGVVLSVFNGSAASSWRNCPRDNWRKKGSSTLIRCTNRGAPIVRNATWQNNGVNYRWLFRERWQINGLRASSGESGNRAFREGIEVAKQVAKASHGRSAPRPVSK
jgi:hypothetical protein